MDKFNNVPTFNTFYPWFKCNIIFVHLSATFLNDTDNSRPLRLNSLLWHQPIYYYVINLLVILAYRCIVLLPFGNVNFCLDPYPCYQAAGEILSFGRKSCIWTNVPFFLGEIRSSLLNCRVPPGAKRRGERRSSAAPLFGVGWSNLLENYFMDLFQKISLHRKHLLSYGAQLIPIRSHCLFFHWLYSYFFA